MKAIPSRGFRGVLVPGVLVLGVAGTGSPGSPRQSRQLEAAHDCLASWLVCELWLCVLRVFQEEGLCGRLRNKDILSSE